MKNKIIDRRLETSSELVNYSFPLRELGGGEQWKEVQELCFTVFSHFAVQAQGSFAVTDLKLVEGAPLIISKQVA